MENYIEALSRSVDKNSSKIQDCIFNELKDAIMYNRISPEEKIVASTLASALGISITPVRNALLQLEKMGFISVKKNCSYRVISYSAKDVRDIYYYRTMLETLSAEIVCQSMTNKQYNNLILLADKVAQEAILSKSSNISRQLDVEQADMAFHSYLVECSGNKYLIEAHKKAMPKFFYVRQFIDNRLTNSAFADEHHMICQALRAGNPKLCTAMIEHHLNFSTIIQ